MLGRKGCGCGGVKGVGVWVWGREGCRCALVTVHEVLRIIASVLEQETYLARYSCIFDNMLWKYVWCKMLHWVKP